MFTARQQSSYILLWHLAFEAVGQVLHLVMTKVVLRSDLYFALCINLVIAELSARAGEPSHGLHS